MREKNMPKNNKKQTNITLPRLFKVVTFWFLKLRSPTSPVFRSLIGPNHIPSSLPPYATESPTGPHRSAVLKMPVACFCRLTKSFLRDNVPWGQASENGFMRSLFLTWSATNLDFTKLWDGIGVPGNLWKLRIPYRTWDVVICLTWGKTSKLHQDTVTSASACREVSGRLMMSGSRLRHQKKTYDPKNPNRFLLYGWGFQSHPKSSRILANFNPFLKGHISGFLGWESYFVPAILLIKWSWNSSIHLDTELPSHIKKWQGGYLKKHLWVVCLLRPIFMNGPMTYFHRKPPSPKDFGLPFWTNPNPNQSTQPTNQPQPNIYTQPPTNLRKFLLSESFSPPVPDLESPLG